MAEKVRKPRISKEHWEMIFYGALGLLLTVLSFLIFRCLRDWILVTVLLCLVDVIYTYYNVRVFFRSLKRKIEQPIMIVLFMFMYWLLLFCLISVGTGVAKVPFSYINFVYPIFLMPAFEIEIILLAVIMSGI